MVIVIGGKRVRISYMEWRIIKEILIFDIIMRGYWLMGNGWSLMIVECMLVEMLGRIGNMCICCFIGRLRMNDKYSYF